MIKSSKPRYQRFYRFNAPLHQRQHFVHAHIDKALKQKLSLKRRAVQLARGDTVKIMSGSKRGTTGKVTRINLRTGKIFIDGCTRKNAKGKESNIPINSSNVYITELNLSDKIRAAKLKLQQDVKGAQKEKEEKKTAKEEQAKKATEEVQQAPKPQPLKIEQDANR
jgi:large subunit ribosomal protein L24